MNGGIFTKSVSSGHRTPRVKKKAGKTNQHLEGAKALGLHSGNDGNH